MRRTDSSADFILLQSLPLSQGPPYGAVTGLRHVQHGALLRGGPTAQHAHCVKSQCAHLAPRFLVLFTPALSPSLSVCPSHCALRWRRRRIVAWCVDVRLVRRENCSPFLSFFVPQLGLRGTIGQVSFVLPMWPFRYRTGSHTPTSGKWSWLKIGL